MATLHDMLEAAVGHHQAGRLEHAERLYRQVLQAAPNLADAWHLWGVLQSQQGKYEAAADCLRRAIGLNALTPAYHGNLGLVYRRLKRFDEAAACYRQALELKPDSIETLNNLGNTLLDQGHFDAAVACYRQAVELQPGFVEAHGNLGSALEGQGKFDEAAACYRRCLELSPDSAEACNSLGRVLQRRGQLGEAVACYRRASELRPDSAEALVNLGNALKAQGRLEEAVVCCQRALQQKPDFAEALVYLGIALKAQGKLEEAVACHRRALELKPGLAEAHNNLGNALLGQGKFDAAEACYRRALQLKPDYPEAHGNLGTALTEQGKLDEAAVCCRRALDLKPDFAAARSNLLLIMRYQTGVTLAELAGAHAEYERRHAAPLRSAWRRHENLPDPERRLRLGFLSPDFGRHPVGFFLIRALENLAQHPCETVCYCDRLERDPMTARFQATATLWRDVLGQTDEQVAEQIRADRIDILFDVAGHTRGNRLLAFARKPAPIQMSWIGGEGTTGLQAMDYLVADRYVVPADAACHYCEKVLCLPETYVCYDPPAAAPPVSSLPALPRGHVTFGCFNNPAKITAEVIEVWSRILRRLPAARLVLKYKGVDDRSSVERFRQGFARHGIDAGRVDLLGSSPYGEYLTHYQGIDVALDPFPFCGGVTTCEALWMGVPVITCPGETFAGRHSLSYLSNIGCTETIAWNLEEYADLAVSLAGDLPRLAALRAHLRQQAAGSPLCDGKRFAAHLMLLLRDVWRHWIGRGR